MKFISWNVNGLRACVKKGFLEYFTQVNADIFCIQETKLQAGQIDLTLDGYHDYWHYASKKKGYSGVAVFTKIKPMQVFYGIGVEKFDEEGRTLTLEFADFYLVNAYVPNSQRDLARLDFRLEWEDLFFAYLKDLGKNKPIILCGDMNVAHEEIDLKNYKTNKGNSGFTLEERARMSNLLHAGFIDSFRHLYPETRDKYTWWSYMKDVRSRNIGWRIDYFLVAKSLENQLQNAFIDNQILGSDHCPIGLELGERTIE